MALTHEEALARRRASYHALTEDQLREKNAKHLAWYHRTKNSRKVQLAEYDRRSYWRHREKHQAKAKRWVEQNPERAKIHNRRKALKGFGLTLVDYDAMLTAQGGVCAICGEKCKSGRRLAVDHCHATGAVRGLLCQRCNHGVGMFKDSIALLDAAKKYLAERTVSLIVTNYNWQNLPMPQQKELQ